jgi:c-di-GMP-binding flagellar brake protein YcgR
MSQQDDDPRLDPRVKTRVRVIVFGAGPDRHEIEMTTENLSASGALCSSPVAPPVGQSVNLRIDLTEAEDVVHQVVTRALVVRVEGGGPFGVALHFVDVSGRVKDRLKHFILGLLPGPGSAS